MDNGYSICMNKWSLDKDIKNELGLLLIISSLCAEKGYCYASNEYLATLFDLTNVSISTKIKKLEEKGYIEIEYKKRGCEIISREIRLKNILIHDLKKFKSTIKENFKENNISNNNININKKEIYKERFKKPTLQEIKDYIKENGYINVDPDVFYDYFTKTNWVDSKGDKVKNWKGKIITWNSYKNKKENLTLPEWFDKEIKKESISNLEEKEIQDIVNSFQ